MGRSLNQTKQLFVAKSYGEIDSDSEVGTIFAKASKDKSDIILKYVNAAGEQTGSGIIKADNILYVSAKTAESERDYLTEWTVKLNDKPLIGGKDYLLKVKIANYLDSSDINEYVKIASVRTYTGMSENEFFAKMATILAKNFNRELDKPIKVFVGGKEITPSTKEEDITGATSIVIKEAEPYWKRNSFGYSRYRITIEPVNVEIEGADMQWAEVTEAKGTEYVKNGKKICDLEDFALTLGGDYNHGYSDGLSSTPLAEPNKEYNVLTIHYCYVGNNESAQKSEQDIVVVSENAGAINSIISVINTATGKTFDTLS